MNITIQIPDERIRDLLCSAFEGGSNYWITHVEIPPRNMWPKEAKYFHELPTYGGELVVHTTGEESGNDLGKGNVYKLNQAALESGMKVFTTTEPLHHFANLLKEDNDAETADVFLQCCLFGKSLLG